MRCSPRELLEKNSSLQFGKECSAVFSTSAGPRGVGSCCWEDCCLVTLQNQVWWFLKPAAVDKVFKSMCFRDQRMALYWAMLSSVISGSSSETSSLSLRLRTPSPPMVPMIMKKIKSMIRLDLMIYEMCHLSEHFFNAQVLNFEKDLNCRVGQCYEAIEQ